MKDEPAENDFSSEEKAGWIKHKYLIFKKTIINLLTTGLTPSRLALGITVGFAAGTFPILGTHTILGIIFAFLLRLNQAAVYAGIWISFPAFVALLLPFLRVGEFITFSEKLRWNEFYSNFLIMVENWDNFFHVLNIYSHSIWHMIIGWVLILVVISAPIYFLSYYLFLQFSKKGIKNPE
ncbi:MAG: DUF2062 domain-containing protein [Spirochaetia bacterium]|nr:DUF2062 domain-containing protein [Spirochaetia bacterium]